MRLFSVRVWHYSVRVWHYINKSVTSVCMKHFPVCVTFIFEHVASLYTCECVKYIYLCVWHLCMFHVLCIMCMFYLWVCDNISLWVFITSHISWECDLIIYLWVFEVLIYLWKFDICVHVLKFISKFVTSYLRECDIITVRVCDYICESVTFSVRVCHYIYESATSVCLCDNVSVCVTLYLRECDICLCATFSCLYDIISLNMWQHFIPVSVWSLNLTESVTHVLVCYFISDVWHHIWGSLTL